MNLAEATSALRAKEAEKMTVLDEISKLETAQYAGSLGSLVVSIRDITHLGPHPKEGFTFITRVGTFRSEEGALASEITVPTVMSDDKEIRFDAIITITPEQKEEEEVAEVSTVVTEDSGETMPALEPLTPAPAPETVSETEAAPAPAPVVKAESITITYRAALEIRSLPTDTFLQTELEAVNTLNEQDRVTLVVRVNFSDLASQVESKKTELAEIYREMDQVKEAIKNRPQGGSSSSAATSNTATTSPAKKAGSTGTGKGPRKSVGGKKGGKKSSASSTPAIEDVASSSSSSGDGSASFQERLLRGLSSSVVTGSRLALEHYSVPLFAAAAAAIYFYGDYASV